MRLAFLFLLFWLGSLQAAGLMPADHLPERIASPLLWWGVDMGGGDAASPDTPDLVAALAQWLAHPPASLRPLPERGLRLGLLAITPDAQGVMAARILHPPVALDLVRDWPQTQRYRQIELAAGATLTTGDWQQSWASDGADELRVLLPLPPDSQRLHQAVLVLPLQSPPADAVTMQLTLRDPAGAMPDWQGQLHVSAAGDALPVDLRQALIEWGGMGRFPARFQLAIRPLPPGHGGRWQAWSAQTPAFWRVSWQEAAHRASGREQLQSVLAGLLASAGQRPASDAGALWQAMATLLAGQSPAAESDWPESGDDDVDCLPAAGLLLGVRPALDDLAPAPRDALRAAGPLQAWRLMPVPELWPRDAGVRHPATAQLPTALTRWQDQRLAPPVGIAEWQPRLRAGVLQGWDMISAQPLPGRALWPGNLRSLSCQPEAACADAVPPVARLDDGLLAFPAAAIPILDDAGRAAGEAFSSLPPDVAEAAPVTAGSATWLDAGELPGYMLWLSAAGEFILLDGADNRPLWRWLPASLRPVHALLRQDAPAASPLPTPRLLPWRGGSGVSRLYAAVSGELVAMDLADPLQPRHLFRSGLPAGWLGGLALLPALLPDGQRRPLLLAASAPGADAGLRLLDGDTGDVLWRADSHDDPALSAGWRAPWAVLADRAGGLLLYGMDVAGQVWHLPILQALPLQIGPLRRVASLPGGILTGSWDQPLSLAWMQQGGWLPALAAVASSESGAEDAMLYVWLDAPGERPRPLDVLPRWPEDSLTPPEHMSGWRRPFSAGERVLAAPRWLRRRVVTSSRVRLPGTGCAWPVWQHRLLVLPWQRVFADVPVQAQLAVSAQPLPAMPLLRDDGSLRLPGGEILLPASTTGSRERLGKRLLPVP